MADEPEKMTSKSKKCTTCVDNKMGYAEFFDYAEKQNAKGIYQKQCPECGLWKFPEDFLKKKKEKEKKRAQSSARG